MLKKTNSKTHRKVTVIGYIRKGQPATQLVRLGRIDSTGMNLITVHNFNQLKNVAIDIVKYFSKYQYIQIRAAGRLKVLGLHKSLRRSTSIKKSDTPLHSYKLEPTWLKLSEGCLSMEHSLLRGAKGSEIAYVRKNVQWQIIQPYQALDLYQKTKRSD